MPLESNKTEGIRTNRHRARVVFANYVIEETGVLLKRQLTAEIIGGSGASLEDSAYTTVVEGATYTTAAERDAYQAAAGGAVITTPSAPTNVTAVAGVRQATVTWTAPSIGGSITLYTVRSSPGNFTATSSTTSAIVTGLSNNTSYTFTVTATNVAGTSLASSPSGSITTPNVPGVPTGVTAVAGDTIVTVSFTPPASDGGSAITSYRAISSRGQSATGTSSPITVTGFQNGNAVTMTVTATNAVGTSSQSSPSASVTPIWPNGSIQFNGTSSFLSWNGASAGASTFTVECFIYVSDFTNRNVVLGATYVNVAVNTQLVISVMNSTTIRVERMNGGTSNDFTVPTMSTNTWYHLAYVRGTSDTSTVFLAGTRSSTGTVTDSTSYSYASGLIGIYRPTSNLANAGFFKGNINNFRWTFSPVYDPTATTITVPTSNLTNITNTQLLLNTLYSSAQAPGVFLVDTSSFANTVFATSVVSSSLAPF